MSGVTFEDVKAAVRAYGVKGENDVTAVAPARLGRHV